MFLIYKIFQRNTIQPSTLKNPNLNLFSLFKMQLQNADGIVIVIPEYNGSYPGALKYFIDMLTYPDSFEKRPVAFVGISSNPWGAIRPVEHMQGVWGYRNAFMFNERVFIPKIWGELDEKGRVKEGMVRDLLLSETKDFCSFIKGLQSS